ncbi:unknown [Firmicutes bacterium CAG:145]|nr:unknown [Firmicutes bacterium CAG:145]
MTASMTDPVSILFPPVPVISPITGTMTMRPKKPYTIDGMPASRSTTGLKNLYILAGQNHVMNTAQSRATGTPSIMAPPVI